MENAQTRRPRWDALVKITHWGIAALIVCNALIVGEGSIAHIYAGYMIAALLALRLVWGFVGPGPARFSSFPPSPRRAIRHVRDIFSGRKETHISHNPLGALMAYALWATLGVIVASGVAMAGPPPDVPMPLNLSQVIQDGDHENEGHSEEEYEEYERGEEEAEEVLEEVHETAVNLLYLLIILHIVGVLFESTRSGRRVATAMLPGGK